ncbi:WD repeat-containing protein 55 homolog [Tribolium madens]|uniref:WD repeat-containing protein 55 homolog n=1 Tax=Tribolium madens TaxID=41895 RepID=UPI001CF7223B|nr:WD repeat-containing protein 55 homolog [Tribolium madens]
MCNKSAKNVKEEEMDSDSDDSDVSMSDSDENGQEIESSDDENEESEEEEDEVIKAIRSAAEKKRDHPPVIHCEDFITDISFHPHEDLLAVASIVGDVIFYKYSNEENSIVRTLEVHTKACRDIEFSEDGKSLFSAAKDKTVMISDVESGKLSRFYDKAHEAPIYCLLVVDENLFATGDDEGCVKLWDLRQNSPNPVYRTKKNEDYISDLVTNEAKSLLLCSSGDGSLTTIDLNNRKIHMQSEEYDEELTCLGLFRSESKLLAGSSKGRLFLYNWNEFGLHSDIFPGTKSAINDLVPITENIVVTACEDGVLRATHLFPHRHLGIVGQHDLSVEKLDICNNGQFIASSSHNNDIKFWNIKYFEDFEKVSHKHRKHEKKKEMQNNLPSSKVQNAADFFSGLC